MMTLTFLAHSGALVEWEHFYTLFDFYRGELPPLRADKPLLVFVSHRHSDHYDPRIYSLSAQHPDVRWFLSRDAYPAERHRAKLGVTDEVAARCTALRADSLLLSEVNGEELSIRAIKSTDIGVAYLLRSEGRMVLHAGDLNNWHWEDEGEAYCANMERAYRRALDSLCDGVRDEAVDSGIAPALELAMFPLDPRLERFYAKGLDELLARVEVRHVLPIHLWERFDTVERYCAEHPATGKKMLPVVHDGQVFRL